MPLKRSIGRATSVPAKQLWAMGRPDSLLLTNLAVRNDGLPSAAGIPLRGSRMKRKARPARSGAPLSLFSKATDPARQCCPPPLASSSVRSTASRLNEAGFWRGGNFLNPSICCATTACIS